MLRKDSFKWDCGADEAFGKTKAEMAGVPVFALPNFNRMDVIESDASKIRIGTVLMQDGRPLPFASNVLSPQHQKMPVYDKEMMAIVYAVTKWRPYLLERHFQIKIDHKSIKFILEQ